MFICGSSSISLKILVVIEVFSFFENKLLLKFVSLFISSHYEKFCTKILKSWYILSLLAPWIWSYIISAYYFFIAYVNW